MILRWSKSLSLQLLLLLELQLLLPSRKLSTTSCINFFLWIESEYLLLPFETWRYFLMLPNHPNFHIFYQTLNLNFMLPLHQHLYLHYNQPIWPAMIYLLFGNLLIRHPSKLFDSLWGLHHNPKIHQYKHQQALQACFLLLVLEFDQYWWLFLEDYLQCSCTYSLKGNVHCILFSQIIFVKCFAPLRNRLPKASNTLSQTGWLKSKSSCILFADSLII